MQIALPRQKTVVEQLWPAAITAVLVLIGFWIIPVQYPVKVSAGQISPAVTTPAQKAEVSWTQDWRQLCAVTVTREFIGSDGFTKTAAPYELQPPKKTGVSPYRGPVTIPTLPDGPASYRSKIEPHCWIDTVWQRRYYTPEIPIVVVQKTPVGPR